MGWALELDIRSLFPASAIDTLSMVDLHAEALQPRERRLRLSASGFGKGKAAPKKNTVSFVNTFLRVTTCLEL
jgi:hypothetical protein